MTSNPPIRSITIQQNESPHSLVKRFIRSIQPYHDVHKQQDLRFFGRVMGIGTERRSSIYERDLPDTQLFPGTTGYRGVESKQYVQSTQDSPSHAVGKDKETLLTGSELRRASQSRRRSTAENRHRAGQQQSKAPELPSPLPQRNVRRPLMVVPSPVVNGPPSMLSSKLSEEETESAQRRLARKLERRARAAIRNPKPPTPPAVIKSKSSRKRQEPISPAPSESPPSQTLRGKISKRQKLAPHQIIAEAYQTKYIHQPNERLTLRPALTNKGFLSAGKASKPIHMSTRNVGRRLHYEQPFNENRFLHLDDEPSTSVYVDKRRTTNREGPKHVTHAFRRSERLARNRRSNTQLLSNRPHSHVHDHDRRSQSSYRLNSNLPPPGKTNSPSWPTASSDISRPRRRFDPPASIRTLSQVNMEDRQGKLLREARQREHQMQERRETERLQMERRIREDIQRAERAKLDGERRRMVEDIAKREYEARHRLEIERERMARQAEYEAHERDRQLHQKKRESGNRGERKDRTEGEKELRGITEGTRWKIPDQHPLHSLTVHRESPRNPPGNDHLDEDDHQQPKHVPARIDFDATGPHTAHIHPYHQYDIRDRSELRYPPYPADEQHRQTYPPDFGQSILAPSIDPQPQGLAYQTPNPQLFPSKSAQPMHRPRSTSREVFRDYHARPAVREQMPPPPIPPRTYLHQRPVIPSNLPHTEESMPPPPVPARPPRTQPLKHLPLLSDMAHQCRNHKQLPPSSSTQRGKILTPALPINALLQETPSSAKPVEAVKGSIRSEVPRAGRSITTSKDPSTADIAKFCREHHRLPPPTPQGGNFSRGIVIPPSAPRQPIF
ncbi:uncharacterized protein I303_102217 [Kwoniella dejecticola CBS 10117]|uniref:Uncharacterized protein n=1 Tax=Kwoniella dejecticola CBS 10117 TaxID=1296121 RepID=A0A1A6ABK9_9TREE|nr:uncharacterized protein I303_01643 [Kwoniella dejecticola CBS 10117]OBR87439.1 hypothetical protein I303_01643 [Kwoniella dejecticola CBS 10117]